MPGITWTPLSMKNVETGKPEPMDRIDRLYLKGSSLRILSAKTLPEKLEEESIPKTRRLFPSDHCAVLIRMATGASR